MTNQSKILCCANEAFPSQLCRLCQFHVPLEFPHVGCFRQRIVPLSHRLSQGHLLAQEIVATEDHNLDGLEGKWNMRKCQVKIFWSWFNSTWTLKLYISPISGTFTEDLPLIVPHLIVSLALWTGHSKWDYLYLFYSPLAYSALLHKRCHKQWRLPRSTGTACSGRWCWNSSNWLWSGGSRWTWWRCRSCPRLCVSFQVKVLCSYLFDILLCRVNL